MKLFRRRKWRSLARIARKQLEEAEGRVEILLKKADGKAGRGRPFDPRGGRRNRDAPTAKPAASPIPCRNETSPQFLRGRPRKPVDARFLSGLLPGCNRANLLSISYGDGVNSVFRPAVSEYEPIPSVLENGRAIFASDVTPALHPPLGRPWKFIHTYYSLIHDEFCPASGQR